MQAGDTEAAAARLQLFEGIAILTSNEQAESLAKELLEKVPLPQRAAADAVHIALAAIHKMDYLLTWNCAHIANAALRDRIASVCHRAGYDSPTICTPEELQSEDPDHARG